MKLHDRVGHCAPTQQTGIGQPSYSSLQASESALLNTPKFAGNLGLHSYLQKTYRKQRGMPEREAAKDDRTRLNEVVSRIVGHRQGVHRLSQQVEGVRA
jgi:hypothetical protein